MMARTLYFHFPVATHACRIWRCFAGGAEYVRIGQDEVVAGMFGTCGGHDKVSTVVDGVSGISKIYGEAENIWAGPT